MSDHKEVCFMTNTMKYNIYKTAAVAADSKMEIKDMLDIADAFLFMMSAMSLAIILL